MQTLKLVLFLIGGLLCFGRRSDAQSVETNVVYFLAAEMPGSKRHNDSFVLPLTHPEHIEHARMWVSDPAFGDRRIPVTRVAKGRNDINRDYYDLNKRAWNWHATEFVGFSDYTLGTPASTWPAFVETASDEWFETFGHDAAFFSEYMVVQELGTHPLWVVSAQQAENMIFQWADLGDTFAYTVEAASILGEWQPVPGISWPILGTTATVPVVDGTSFFRVRADPR